MKKILLTLSLVAVTTAAFSQDRASCSRLGRMTECVTVPLASAAQDGEAKRFAAPPADKARIYLVRSRTIEPLTKTQIYLDGKPTGQLAPKTYVVLDVAPGDHELKAKTDHEFDVRISTQAGQTYFVEHRLTLAFNTTSGKLVTVDDACGKQRVMRSALAATR